MRESRDDVAKSGIGGNEGTGGFGSRIEQLYAEFLVRCDRGEPLDFDSFCAQHTADEGELRELHGRLDELRAAGLGGATLSSQLPREMLGLADDGRVVETIAQLEQLRPTSQRYIVGEQIAEGGMGCILAARDIVLHRDLAMKVLRGRFLGNQSAVARLLDEAQVTGQLQHPAIVPVHDLGLTADGELFFMMKLVEGEDLSEVFRRVDRSDRRELLRALGLILRVCEALSYAHERGVLHRDLKPANIRVGSFGEVYVMDWGLARVRELVSAGDAPGQGDSPETTHPVGESPFKTIEGDALGTPCYMSPEQARGHLDEMDARADVYSLGAILYELLAGVVPHVREGEGPGKISGSELLRRAMHDEPADLAGRCPDAPPELISICAKAMSRDRDARYGNMLELQRDLSDFMEDRVVLAHETGALVELQKWVRRNRGMAATIAGTVVVLLSGAGTTIGIVQANNREKSKVIVERNAVIDQRDLALVEVTRASDLAKQSLAGELLSNGRTLGSRGKWREALDVYGEAAVADEKDTLQFELQLARAEAHMALYERDTALNILGDMHGRRDLGELESRLNLQLGALTLVGWRAKGDEHQTGMELIEAALESDLSDADREFALALKARRTSESIAHLEAARGIDPFHYLANSLSLSFYLFSGRTESANSLAETMSMIYPEDPSPQLGLIMSEAFQFEIESARQHLSEFADRLPPKTIKRIEKVFEAIEQSAKPPHLGSYFGCSHSIFSAAMVNRAYVYKLLGVLQRDELRQMIPQLPSLRNVSDQMVEGMQLVSQGNFEEGEKKLREVLELHEDALLYYTVAACHIANMPEGTPDTFTPYLQEAIEFCSKAESTPTLLPMILEPSKFLRVHCEAMVAQILYTETPSPEVLERAIQGIRSLESLTTAEDCVLPVIRSEMVRRGAREPLRYEISKVWLELRPESDLAAEAFIADARAFDKPLEAMLALEELSARRGQDDGLMATREALLAELKSNAPEAVAPIEASFQTEDASSPEAEEE